MKNNFKKNDFKVNLIVVPSNDVGRRIDNFLLMYLKKVPRDKIYRILRTGEIRVNKKRVKWLYRLRVGDIIRIPPIWFNTSKNIVVKYSKETSKKLYDSFLYEDDTIIVINKPSGIAVHGGSGLSCNIVDGLRMIRPDLHFLQLVHRLDRDTSGVLLLAKNYFALSKLHEQFRLQKMKKEYLALVSGECNFFTNTVISSLSKNNISLGSCVRFVKSTKEKYSKTHFMVKERFISSTLLKVYPITGRTHQIRIHAQYMGYPIACDNRYGNVIFNQKMAVFGLNRLFLHAYKLIFIHPSNQRLFFIKAPMDGILLNCLSFLRN